VLFGERGVGKTSLLNVVAAELSGPISQTVVWYTCSHSDTFIDIIRKYLDRTGQLSRTDLMKITAERELSATLKIPVAEGGASSKRSEEHLRSFVVPNGITPDSIATQYLGGPGILIVDEFDRISDHATKVLIAETIKIQADRVALTKIVLCGVGISADDVIGGHPSTVRNLFTMRLGALNDEEIGDLVATGFKKLGLRYEPGVIELIIRAAHGLPYFAHLLGEELAILVTTTGARLIRTDDFFTVLGRALRNVSPAITSGFERMFIPSSEDVVLRPELLGQELPRGGPLVPASIRRAVVMALAVSAESDLDRVSKVAISLMRSINEFVPSDYEKLSGSDAGLAVDDAEKLADFVCRRDDNVRFTDAFARGYTWLKAAQRYGRAALLDVAIP
jgi:hypothetical protein